jgi:hypothetical protein
MSRTIAWYDREGKEITDIQEVERKLGDQKYRSVKRTKLKNEHWVSTVWLGLDQSFDGSKIIFESMVFPPDGSLIEVDGNRYRTQAQALRGHARLVRKWAHTKPNTKKEKT